MEGLTPDLFHCVTQFLTNKEIIEAQTVSKDWNELLGRNCLWKPRLERLWEGKICIPEESRKLEEKRQYRLAFKTSTIDAQRTSISEEELTQLGWNFRFKRAAGFHWIQDDPYWQTGEAVKVKFKTNRRMVRDRNIDDMIFHWFRDPKGKFVRVNSFPAYIVWRHPGNWGFVMESCWVLYTSFEMPPQDADPILAEDNLEISCRLQEREILMYSTRVNDLRHTCF